MNISKETLLEALESVIGNLNNQLNTSVRDAFDYVKLDQKKRAFEEVRDFVNNMPSTDTPKADVNPKSAK